MSIGLSLKTGKRYTSHSAQQGLGSMTISQKTIYC
jgi:hypothetical protein